MALATTDDIATRLGRTLTEAEEAMAQQTIDLVTGMIAEAAGKDADWVENLDPLPTTLRALCIDKVIALGANPQSLAAESETLGAHSRSVTYQRANDGGVFISDDEGRRIRFAIYGRAAGTAHPRSRMIHRLTRNQQVAYLVEGDPPQ